MPCQFHGVWIRNVNVISYNEPVGIRHINCMAFGFEMPIQSPITNQLAYATSISWPLESKCQYNLIYKFVTEVLGGGGRERLMK
jgi:hypothetical protein